MSFGFHRIKDHRTWCIAYSMLPLKVGRLIDEQVVACVQSDDPKLKELERVLGQMRDRFAQELHRQMDRIEFEFTDEPPR